VLAEEHQNNNSQAAIAVKCGRFTNQKSSVLGPSCKCSLVGGVSLLDGIPCAYVDNFTIVSSNIYNYKHRIYLNTSNCSLIVLIFPVAIDVSMLI
jgi:hypothetical protein